MNASITVRVFLNTVFCSADISEREFRRSTHRLSCQEIGNTLAGIALSGHASLLVAFFAPIALRMQSKIQRAVIGSHL